MTQSLQMEKESKLSPAVQPFFPKFHRSDDVMGPVRGELATASSSSSSPPLMRLPNPYLSEQFSRRNEAVANPRQRSSATDGVQQGSGGDQPSKHGYSNSRRVRGTADASAYPSKENRSIRDPQSKTPKYNSDSLSQERRHGKRSLDVSRRGLRDTRSAPNSVDRPKSAQTESAVFEVRMTDFPELRVRAGSGSPFVPVQQKAVWVPLPTLPRPESPSPEIQKPVQKTVTLLTRTGPPAKHEPHQRASEAKPASSTVPAGQPAGAPSPTDGSGPVVTSWANVASQPPKAPLPKERTVSGSASKKEATQEEGVSEKKKQRRKKKKKGSKSAGEDGEVDPEEAVAQQEPPKFEDEEEFPGLAVAKKCLASSNTTKLCNEPSQREGVQPQQGDHQHKDKATVGKSLPTDTTKKAQKAEKASGKKSKAPVQLDIGNMLTVLEKKQQSHKTKQEAKPVTVSVGGALPAACHKSAAMQRKLPWQQDKIAHNPLDSTSPMVKKGKQREVPKAKKPTPLKRVILKEREERKQNRLLEERGLLPGQEEPRPAEQHTATEEQCDPSDTGQPQHTATEEQCDPSDTDEISSPTGPEDEPEGHLESNQTEQPREAEEEEEEEVGGEQTNTQAPPPVLRNAPKIHSRKFRDYCSQVLSRDVDECVTTLLKELVRFQDRLYQKDPMKARMKRRLVMGLREVLKHLKLRKVKCVVISPNCERSQSKGGLDEALHNIINTCREQGVPFVFALSRKALGRCVNKAVPVSLVGIFNYDGAQDFYHKMIELSSEARRAYEVMVENVMLAGDQEGEDLTERHDTEADPDTSEEPEYITLWKTMLEKECDNESTLDHFEEQLSSMRLASDGTEQSDECEQS